MSLKLKKDSFYFCKENFDATWVKFSKSRNRVHPLKSAKARTVRQIWYYKRGYHKPLNFNGGDEGSRTPVQNGSKQTSTGVDIYFLGLFREYQDLYK